MIISIMPNTLPLMLNEFDNQKGFSFTSFKLHKVDIATTRAG